MAVRGISTFDQPVGGAVEAAAATAVRMTRGRFRHHRTAWAPTLVAVAGFLAAVLVLLVVGELLSRSGLFATVRSWDTQVSRTLADNRSPGWDRFSELGSKSAETLPVVIAAFLVELVLALRRRWRDLLVVAVGLALELSIFLTVNETVRRPRPSVHKLGSVPSTFSFPSGHTAATVVLYGSIVLLATLHRRSALARVLGWLFVVLVTVAVGYSRVYRGMHHVTDVTAGALMGLVCLAVTVSATRASSLAMEDGSLGERGRDRTEVGSEPGRTAGDQRNIKGVST